MTIDRSSSVTPNQVMDALAEQNVETRPIWKPMHLQPVFAEYDFIMAQEEARFAAEEDTSVAGDIFARGLCLPSDIKNTKEDMELIVHTVRKCFRG